MPTNLAPYLIVQLDAADNAASVVGYTDEQSANVAYAVIDAGVPAAPGAVLVELWQTVGIPESFALPPAMTSVPPTWLLVAFDGLTGGFTSSIEHSLADAQTGVSVALTNGAMAAAIYDPNGDLVQATPVNAILSRNLITWRALVPGATSPTSETQAQVAREMQEVSALLAAGMSPITSAVDAAATANDQSLGTVQSAIQKQISTAQGQNTTALNQVAAQLNLTATAVAPAGLTPASAPGSSGSGTSTAIQPGQSCVYTVYGGGLNATYTTWPDVVAAIDADLPSNLAQTMAAGSILDITAAQLAAAVAAMPPVPSGSQQWVGGPANGQGSYLVAALCLPSGAAATQTIQQLQQIVPPPQSPPPPPPPPPPSTCPQCGCPVNVVVQAGTGASGQLQPVSPVVDFSEPFAHIAGLVSDQAATKVEDWLGADMAPIWTYGSFAALAGAAQLPAQDTNVLDQAVLDLIPADITDPLTLGDTV